MREPSVEIEKSVIGRIFALEGLERVKFLSQIRPEYFSAERHQKILEEMIKNPDHTKETLITKLELDEQTAEFLDMYSEDGNERHIELLKESYLKAGLYMIKNGIELSLEKASAERIIWSVSRRINELTREIVGDTGDLREAYERLNKLGDDDLIFYTGLNGVDRLTGGHRRGRVWVVGGNSGTGKSYFALNMVWNQIKEGHNVLFFSTELTREENFRRLAELYQAEFAEPDFEKCKKGMLDFFNLKVYSDYTTTDSILFEIKRQKLINGVDFVVIDHLQDMEATGRDTEYESIKKTCMAFKSLSIKENIATLLISQMNRSSVAAKHSGDVLGFSGSGSIEQSAHVAIILYRDEDNIKVMVRKNRSGNTGTVTAELKFPGGVYREIIQAPDPYSHKSNY